MPKPVGGRKQTLQLRIAWKKQKIKLMMSLARSKASKRGSL